MIVCDCCDEPMAAKSFVQRKVINGKAISRTYLKCEHCGAEYTSYYDDDKTLALKEEIRKLVGKVCNDAYADSYDKNLDTMTTKQERLKHMTNKLKRKYAKYFE